MKRLLSSFVIVFSVYLVSFPGFASPARAENVISVLGDSLTAGYGLKESQSYPVRLEQVLGEKGYNVTIKNAGVSGDTSAGGLARIDWVLSEKPDGLIVALGGNDTLRGLEPERIKENLLGIIEQAQSRDIPVLLMGMYATPNLGKEYAAEFNAVYPEIVEKTGVLFYPFFLKGVAADPALNQEDRIHPNPKGVEVMVENTVSKVIELIDRIKNQQTVQKEQNSG